MPQFNADILRKPERLHSLIETLCRLHPEFSDVADVASMCLSSSASNDYLEKIGAESIGAIHLDAKLGGDGTLNSVFDRGSLDTSKIEVKPKKGSPGVANLGCINDDTPMKLLENHRTYSYIVFINALKGSTRINYALCVPYKYFEAPRFKQIVKRLGLTPENWSWGDVLPVDLVERRRCLEEFVGKHKPYTYVRSNELSLKVLPTIPKEEVLFWKHPDQDSKKLHAYLRAFC